MEANKTYRWVAGSERMPVIDDAEDYPKEWLIRIKGDDPRSGWIHAEFVTAEDMREIKEEYFEWLEEIPSSPATVKGEEKNIDEILREMKVHMVDIHVIPERRKEAWDKLAELIEKAQKLITVVPIAPQGEPLKSAEACLCSALVNYAPQNAHFNKKKWNKWRTENPEFSEIFFKAMDEYASQFRHPAPAEDKTKYWQDNTVMITDFKGLHEIFMEKEKFMQYVPVTAIPTVEIISDEKINEIMNADPFLRNYNYTQAEIARSRHLYLHTFRAALHYRGEFTSVDIAKHQEAIKLLYCAVADVDIYDDQDSPGMSIKEVCEIGSRALAKFHEQFPDEYLKSLSPLKEQP